jgi:hypothetical protein
MVKNVALKRYPGRITVAEGRKIIENNARLEAAASNLNKPKKNLKSA